VFNPDEIIFVPEATCNLHCSHCYVNHTGQKTSIESALKILRECADHNVTRVGFSGGEPFIRPEFLNAVTEVAVECDLLFDRVMTNGVWYKNQEHLEKVLGELYRAGFDGKIGLSFDYYHGQNISKVARFIESAAKIWGERSVIELVAVHGIDESQTIAMYKNLAQELSAELLMSDKGFPKALYFYEALESSVQYERQDGETIVVGTIDLAPEKFDDPIYWQDEEWFTEDYCQGPGNVLYVHADGSVGGCCGYSNELDELVIGNIENDNFVALMKQASSKEMMKLAYIDGLSSELKRLQDEGHIFPGITKSNCQFCRYVIDLKRSK